MKVRNEANSAWVTVAKKEGSGWTPYRQGTALGTASVEPDTRYAHRSNNLSDLANARTARGNLGVAQDSYDPDFTNNPNAAARRGLVAAAIAAATATTQEDPYVGLAANLVAGGLGSLVFAYSTGGDVAFGGTVAGSALRPVGAARSVSGSVGAVLESGSALTGTWTCLGYFDSTETNNTGGESPSTATIQGATLWQRTL